MSRAIAVFLSLLCLTGCPSGPPVQELSDARQAIAAAANAGATPSTSPDLYAAEAAIGRAEKHLEAKEYVRARLAAQEAKHHATAALDSTERTAADPAAASAPH
jgi:outer membrane murein-binding lipoprotein Lpp